MYKQTGFKAELLDDVIFPEGLRHVWNYFNQLSNKRTSNGFGYNPISYTEIYNWNVLTGSNITSEEIKILDYLDITFLNFQAKKAKK